MITIIHSLPYFNIPLIDASTWLTPPGSYKAMTCRERELNPGSHTFFTTQGHGGPPGWGICSMPGPPLRQHYTSKTIHTRYTPIHSSKANMEGWLWRPNDIGGPYGAKASDIVLRARKYPEKNSPRKHVPTGDRSSVRCVTGAHPMPPPQRWTKYKYIGIKLCYKNDTFAFDGNKKKVVRGIVLT